MSRYLHRTSGAGRASILLLTAVFGAAGTCVINGCRETSSGTIARQKAQAVESRRWKNSVGMSFVRIRSGAFTMGSDSGASGSPETPAHKVLVSRSFCLAATEVTQAQWTAVMGTNPSRFRGDRLPVEQVSWNDAKAFIRKLNAKEGSIRYRLPTEAEWEYACRAGTTGPWYGDLSAAAWYAANSGGTSHPVGQKQPNAWGLYDMLGNVYEWCEDRKGAYPQETVTDPQGPPDGLYRVVRGGSWLIHDNRARSYFRDFLAPDYLRDDVGFRVAADAAERTYSAPLPDVERMADSVLTGSSGF